MSCFNPANLPLHLVVVILLCFAGFSVSALADPIAEDVKRAEGVFLDAVAKEKAELTESIKAAMEQEIQAAADAGDLDTLESLQNQLKAYERDGSLPRVEATRPFTQSYKRKLAHVGDDLIDTYEDATLRFTRARDVANARLMQEKLKWIRPTADRDTHEYRGQLYLFVKGQKSWSEAQAECEKLGGYLACLNSRAEHRFIYEKITKKMDRRSWVGGTDAHKEGDWIWIDGSKTDYWPWHPDEPSNDNRTQHYAIMNTGGTLSDFEDDDDRAEAYLIEWDSVPTRETVYQPKPADDQR